MRESVRAMGKGKGTFGAGEGAWRVRGVEEHKGEGKMEWGRLEGEIRGREEAG